jgi:hypothetical protein
MMHTIPTDVHVLLLFVVIVICHCIQYGDTEMDTIVQALLYVFLLIRIQIGIFYKKCYFFKLQLYFGLF